MSTPGSNTSPQPTPPCEMPKSVADWRFEFIPFVECVEAYRPGGYHPVHIGDSFHNQRYKVVEKLGYGQYSTVWLAQDVQSSEFVALKINKADCSSTDREVAALNHLNTSETSRSGSEHVVRLKDTFYHCGPNGNHLCLVLELLGDNVYTVLQDYSSEITGCIDTLKRFPKPVAKKILRDVLLGLDFLHQNGVVHGDLHPGNFLSSAEGLDVSELKAFEAKGNETTIEVKRRDGKFDKWAPRYLVLPGLPWPTQPDQLPHFPIKISDLGAAILTSDAPTVQTPVMPVGLRSPELILNSHPLDTYIDIWSFGCLMFEMFVGTKLLEVMPPMPGSDLDHCDDDCLLQMNDVLGPLPEDIHSKWPRSKRHFRTGSRELYNSMITGPERILEPFPSMEETIREAVSQGDGLSEDEGRVLLSLLRDILNYDPLKRPSASEILKNSFWDENGEA